MSSSTDRARKSCSATSATRRGTLSGGRWSTICVTLPDASLGQFLERDRSFTGRTSIDVRTTAGRACGATQARSLPQRPAQTKSAICCVQFGGCCTSTIRSESQLYREVLARAPAARVGPTSTTRQRRLLLMLHYDLWGTRRTFPDLDASLGAFWRHAAVREELVELLGVLDERSATLTRPSNLAPEIPLHVHARYTRDEILGAYGEGSPAKPPQFREGVRHIAVRRNRLLLVTLKKAERDYSPTTLYQDYAISPVAVPLGVPVDAERGVADDPALRAARRTWPHHRAVRPREEDARQRHRLAVRVLGACSVRVVHRVTPGVFHVGARDADARGAVRVSPYCLSGLRSRPAWRRPAPQGAPPAKSLARRHPVPPAIPVPAVPVAPVPVLPDHRPRLIRDERRVAEPEPSGAGVQRLRRRQRSPLPALDALLQGKHAGHQLGRREVAVDRPRDVGLAKQLARRRPGPPCARTGSRPSPGRGCRRSCASSASGPAGARSGPSSASTRPPRPGRP